MTPGPGRRRLTPGRYLGVLAGLTLLLALIFLLALTVGGSGLSLADLMGAVVRGEKGAPAVILLDIRLPRAILAAMAGLALAAAGTTFQAILRNPLAEPYILGVSGGAAVGAILSVGLGAGLLGGLLPMRPLGAFAGALATIAVIFRVATLRGRASSYSLILVGVVINSFFSAVILFIITVADFTRFQGVLFWMAGSLSSQPYPVLIMLGVLLVVGMATLMAMGSSLNLVSQGEETASNLGLHVQRVRVTALVAASLLTAAVVSFSGLIGFVGLMVPHIMRLALGPDHRLLLPASGLAGASFLLAADTLARAVFAPTEIPVGIITAVIGGPFFIWLYRRQGGGLGTLTETDRQDVAALEIEALRFAYDGPLVLDGLDLRVERGDLVGIIGPNGSGKTTLLRLVSGSLEPAAGRISLFGRDRTDLTRRQRAQQVSVVPQEARVVFDFTVQEIVLMGRAPHLGLLGIEGEEDRAAAEEALAVTETSHLAGCRLAQLSGGEKQRVLLARGLAQETPLMLLDEPTAFLDIRHRVALYRLVGELRTKRGLTVVAVSHDINLAARFCPRLVMLHEGRVAADGTPHQVVTAEHLHAVYGAEVRILEDPSSGTPLVVPSPDAPVGQGAGAPVD